MRLNKRRPGLAFGSPASKRRPGLAFGSPASRRCAAGRFQVQVSDSDLSLFWISTFESTVLWYYFFIYLNRRSITDTVSLIVRKFEKKRSFEEAFVEFDFQESYQSREETSASLIVYIKTKTNTEIIPGKDNILSGYFISTWKFSVRLKFSVLQILTYLP